jgi:HlyD family secretion protein
MNDGSAPGLDPPGNTSGLALEQLDTLVRVTTASAWISLGILFALCAGAVVFAFLFHVPKKVTGEGILLIERDRLTQVRALGTGRLLKLNVALGDKVVPDQEIGQISQEDLKDTIRETEARLRELQKEDDLLTEFEAGERSSQKLALARLKDALDRTVTNSTEGLGVADKIVEGSNRLRSMFNLSNLEYLKDLQQRYTIQNDLNGGRTKLAELDLTWLTSENQRQKFRLQRQLEISKLKTKLRLDGEKLDRTSRIISHSRGTVTQILSAADAYVREGAPVVLLSSPKEKVPGEEKVPGIEDVGKPYESIVFVPAGEGKKIDEHNFVEVMPATVKREEHGYIHGEVVAVSELPATRLAMEAALQHPDLVDAFLKKYAPGVLLRVHVKLTERPGAQCDDGTEPRQRTGNCYKWSAASGTQQPLKTGTMCEAAIVVKQEPLIHLVLPWIRKLMGYV